MTSPVIKRSIMLAGHKTSVSLEDAFWQSLKEIAHGRDMSGSALIAAIDAQRGDGNLSSAIRLFVLDHYRSRAEPTAAGAREGESKALREAGAAGRTSPEADDVKPLGLRKWA